MDEAIKTRNGRELEDLDNDIQQVNIYKQNLRSLKRQKVEGSLSQECAKDSQQLGDTDTKLNDDLLQVQENGEDVTIKEPTQLSHEDRDHDSEDKSIVAEKEAISQKIEILRENEPSNTNSSKDDEGLEDEWRTESEFYKSVDAKTFRQYDLACDRVKEFYEQQHRLQTVAFNIQARINFKAKVRAKMTVWEGLEKLNKLLDESDPDTELSQIDHALQTAEAIRRDKKPRWMQLVGLIHDLGKLLYFFDSKGQWDVVGDTFPVGCSFLTKIIFSESFRRNPDYLAPSYNTKFGIYSENCGLDKVMLSWGHDEYMYHIAKLNSTIPPEGLAMIRYHSFYPWHQENAYQYLMNDYDKEMLKAVRAFNKYDLYSKADEQYNVEQLKPYYLDLIDEFFPKKTIDF